MKKSKFVNPRFAREGEYKNVIQTIIKEGKCPFCPENFKYHKNPVLKNTKSWFITKSSWPYKNTKEHLIIIGKKHKENFRDIKLNDFKEIILLTNWAIKKFKIKGGGLTLRFGDTNHTGSSVAHIHFHLIAPKIKNNKSVPVNFPIG
ncbi:HIT domain-containing protein [Candidatus Wolfebacteria bacterium]|nr:HIT domain-containing protein [Candidatus Wolfebacteria bacterium]